MSSVILNHRGTPEPSSEIQRRLTAVHPRLNLRYIEGAGRFWAICMNWDERDVRWQHVQAQDVDPNRSMDIIGYLPIDCSVDQAPAYLEKALRMYPKAEMQRIADFVHQYNFSTPVAEAMTQAIAEMLDQADPTGLTVPRKRGRPRKIA